jgi:nitrate reductase gamma subunit
LPFIAAAVLVVAAIYEIGKAFGWWTDASSMMDALWAGVQRLWDAFINHPDVQAVLTALG